MKKISKIYKTFDIVVVPFPFTDTVQTKNRPAVIISSYKKFNNPTGHTILAMITSAEHNKWPLDTFITNFKTCGLLKPSLIRLKLFTLDNRLIKKKIGELASQDKNELKKQFSFTFQDFVL